MEAHRIEGRKMFKRKKETPTPEEQKRIDFLLSYPGFTILSMGGRHRKQWPLYQQWVERNKQAAQEEKARQISDTES